MKEEVIQMVDDDEIENVGIMSGFMDELEELISEIDAEDLENNKGGDEADTAKLMGRTPDSPEILMNNLRGNIRSPDARREELADLVGMREAEETPDGVLTLLQSVLAQQEAAPPMPMAPPMPQGMPPEMMGMPPQGMPPMPPQGMAPPPMGIESISVDETIMPGMYRGGPVQNFNQGSGAMGVTPANDAFSAYPSDVVQEAQRRVRHMVDGGMVQNYNQGGVVQHFQDGSTPPLGVELPGTRGFAPAQREEAEAYISSILGQKSAVVPDLQTAMTNEAAILESLGLGTSKEDRQAEALFKLGQAGFRFAGNVGANGPMQGSTAARLSQVLDPLSSDIGDIAAERNKEQQSLKMLGYQGAKAEIDAVKASNAALAKSRLDVALQVGERPNPSAKEFELQFLKEAFPNETPAQLAARAGMTSGGTLSDRQRNKEELMTEFGFTDAQASEVMMSERYTDPETGQRFSFSPITGISTLIEADYGEESTERFYTMPEASVEMLSEGMGRGTGAVAVFKSMYNNYLGQLGADLYEGVDSDVLKLNFLRNSIVEAVSKGTRVPLLQQDRILALTAEALKIGINPDVAQANLSELVGALGTQYIEDKKALVSPRSGRRAKEEVGERSKAFEGVLRQILQPEAANYMLDTINGESAQIKGYDAMSSQDLANVDTGAVDENGVLITSPFEADLIRQILAFRKRDIDREAAKELEAAIN
mgnify:FL=1